MLQSKDLLNAKKDGIYCLVNKIMTRIRHFE